jgi:ubiquitin-activating enzyme E1 C
MQALKRGEQFNISGITYSLTQGVVKNIVPAIASTNAIIAATCVLETLKIATMCSTGMDIYMQCVHPSSFPFNVGQRFRC